MTCSDVFVEKAFAGAPLDHCLVIDAHGHFPGMGIFAVQL